MSEHAPKSAEKFEALNTPEHAAQPTTHERSKSVHTHEKESKQKLHEARKSVAETAAKDNPLEKLHAAEQAAENANAAPTQVNRELKKITLNRELKQIQHKLPAGQRSFSKIVHQPAVRVISEATGKSISRPSGLLGGGLVAFLGSSSYLYLANHYGFTYNYLVFVLLFVAGFFVGLVLEFIVWTFTARHRAVDL